MSSVTLIDWQLPTLPKHLSLVLKKRPKPVKLLLPLRDEVHLHARALLRRIGASGRDLDLWNESKSCRSATSCPRPSLTTAPLMFHCWLVLPWR
jgi:hypothetical protein